MEILTFLGPKWHSISRAQLTPTCPCNGFMGSVANPDPGSGAFLTPGSGMGKKLGSGRNEQPGSNTWILWCGSGIRDGNNSDPGYEKVWSGINMPDPQHCLWGRINHWSINSYYWLYTYNFLQNKILQCCGSFSNIMCLSFIDSRFSLYVRSFCSVLLI